MSNRQNNSYGLAYDDHLIYILAGKIQNFYRLHTSTSKFFVKEKPNTKSLVKKPTLALNFCSCH